MCGGARTVFRATHLQQLVEQALRLCGAHSAGVVMLRRAFEDRDELLRTADRLRRENARMWETIKGK